MEGEQQKMVTETDTPTREELETEAKNKQAEVKAAEKAHATALKTFESSVGRVPMEQLLDLGRAVDKAKADADNAAKLAKRAQERVDNFELEAKRDERNSLLSGHVEATRASTDFEAYEAVGVEKLVLTIDIAERTVSPKPTGPGIRSTTPRARRENGAGGFTSAGAIRLASGEVFKSVNRAYMDKRTEKDGQEPAPANTASATRWLTANCGGFEYINQ